MAEDATMLAGAAGVDAPPAGRAAGGENPGLG